jgi:hypothetical protein
MGYGIAGNRQALDAVRELLMHPRLQWARSRR